MTDKPLRVTKKPRGQQGKPAKPTIKKPEVTENATTNKS